MRFLVVDDEAVNRDILQKILRAYGDVDMAEDGAKAVELVRIALSEGKPYKLICLDVCMPETDGQAALKSIRGLELKAGIEPGDGAKIFMTTAMDNIENVRGAYNSQCDAYLLKPISEEKLLRRLRDVHLI